MRHARTPLPLGVLLIALAGAAGCDFGAAYQTWCEKNGCATDAGSPLDAAQPGFDASAPREDAATADAAQPAIDAARPEPDAGPGEDAAQPGTDAGPDVDAGIGLDAAKPGLDAAAPGLDAAAPGLDASAPGVDAAAPGLDAGPCNADTGAPVLLFHSGFESAMALSAPTNCWNNGCYQDPTGTDSSTGFTWPPLLPGGATRFQLRPAPPAASPCTPSTIGNYMVNALQPTAGRGGTQALYTENKQSGCCGTGPMVGDTTQASLLMTPATGADVPDLYFSYWVKFQPDLTAKLWAGDEWRSLCSFRTTTGDYDVVVAMHAYGGATPWWIVMADSPAQGGLEHWRVEDHAVPVPVDEWFKLEMFWHRCAGADGRIWVAINGTKIADHVGPNMGVNGSPVEQVTVSALVTGGSYPIYQWIDDLQVWSGFPVAATGDAWYDPPYGPH